MKRRNGDKHKSRIADIVRKGFQPRSVGLEAEQAAKLVLARALANKSREIKKVAMGGGQNPAHNAEVKRFANDKARALKKRTEERREGKECGSTCRFRWSPDP